MRSLFLSGCHRESRVHSKSSQVEHKYRPRRHEAQPWVLLSFENFWAPAMHVRHNFKAERSKFWSLSPSIRSERRTRPLPRPPSYGYHDLTACVRNGAALADATLYCRHMALVGHSQRSGTASLAAILKVDPEVVVVASGACRVAHIQCSATSFGTSPDRLAAIRSAADRAK